MKISEVVEKLEEILEEHGDLETYFFTSFLSISPVEAVGEYKGYAIFAEKGIAYFEEGGDGGS